MSKSIDLEQHILKIPNYINFTILQTHKNLNLNFSESLKHEKLNLPFMFLYWIKDEV